MLSNILNLTNGKTLNKKEQQSINGGRINDNCQGDPCMVEGHGACCSRLFKCKLNICQLYIWSSLY